MSPHGTYSRYSNDGCRCGDCTDAAWAWWHEYRARHGMLTGRYPHAVGPRVIIPIDTGALRRVIQADGRPIAHVEKDAGLSKSAIHGVLRSGRCLAGTFDALCGALGLNGYEIEAASA